MAYKWRTVNKIIVPVIHDSYNNDVVSKAKLNLYLDAATIEKLERLAAKNYRSLSQQVAALVDEASPTIVLNEEADKTSDTHTSAPTNASYRKTSKKKSPPSS